MCQFFLQLDHPVLSDILPIDSIVFQKLTQFFLLLQMSRGINIMFRYFQILSERALQAGPAAINNCSGSFKLLVQRDRNNSLLVQFCCEVFPKPNVIQFAGFMVIFRFQRYAVRFSGSS